MLPGTRSALALVLLGGCTLITDSFRTNDFSGDAYPIDVDTSTGAVMMGLRQDGVPDRSAILDVLSPLTIVDPGPGTTPSVSLEDVLLLGENGPGGPIEQPRAKLTQAQLIALHPCDQPDCVVGPAAGEATFEAIIGADSLAGDAVRLRLGEDKLFVLPDIAGDERLRSRACDAVFPSPYVGGGTLVIAGSELPFFGRRVALEACLEYDLRPDLGEGQRGTDVLFVVSTGIGISILGETAYQRFADAHPCPAASPDAPPCALPLDQLATFATVNLASGPISGKVATIPWAALVATSSSTPRAACRQVYGNHILLERDCQPGEDCPCENGSLFCSTPAVIELTPPGGIQVLVVQDGNPTLQALRTELRPDQPEVDGILGTNAIRGAELDIDYPHDRVLGRCSAASPQCVTRPELSNTTDRTQIFGCLPADNPGVIARPDLSGRAALPEAARRSIARPDLSGRAITHH